MKRPWIKTSFGFKCLRFLFIILSIAQVTCLYFVWVPPLYSQGAHKQTDGVPAQQGVSPASQPPNLLDLDHQQKDLEAKIAEQKELLAFEKEHLSVLDNASRTSGVQNRINKII